MIYIIWILTKKEYGPTHTQWIGPIFNQTYLVLATDVGQFTAFSMLLVLHYHCAIWIDETHYEYLLYAITFTRRTTIYLMLIVWEENNNSVTCHSNEANSSNWTGWYLKQLCEQENIFLLFELYCSSRLDNKWILCNKLCWQYCRRPWHSGSSLEHIYSIWAWRS